MPEVKQISAAFSRSGQKKRVAAYCRVSTSSADQQNSYANQVRTYTRMITQRSDWELVDVFADEGLSGMKASNRKEFQRMIRMCELRQDDLAFLTTQLTAKLVDAIKNHIVNRLSGVDDDVSLSVKLLKSAEIPEGASLDVKVSKGEIHITAVEDEDDEGRGIDDDLPFPILNYLSECGISESILRRALRSNIRIQI